MIKNMKTLSERLKHARDVRGLTQPELAVRAGLSTGTIGNIEIAYRMSKGSIPQIAEALRVSYKWLSEGIGEMELPKPEVDQIGQEFEALRRIYEDLPIEARTGAMLAAIRTMMSFRPKSTTPSEAPHQSHQVETEPAGRQSGPVTRNTQ